MTTPGKTTKAVAAGSAPNADLEARRKGRNRATEVLLTPATETPHTPEVEIRPVRPATGLSDADQNKLIKITRARAKVGKAHIAAVKAELVADFEKRLTEEYEFQDQQWAEVNKIAQDAVCKANNEIDRISEERGVPKDLRPHNALVWHPRGSNLSAGRRAELRKLAEKRADAIGRQAILQIDAQVAEIEADLLAGGLSVQAQRYLEQMDDPRSLMPRIDVAELQEAYHDRHPYERRYDLLWTGQDE